MVYISDFVDVGRADVAVAGGKGAGLGELVRAGLPVPPGFLLNTAAYESFVEANQIGVAIQGHASLPDTASPDDYEEASRRICALFAGGAMPPEVAAELREGYRRLGQGKAVGRSPGQGMGPDSGGTSGADAAVAVRSSATAEDLASASFAGQQDTYLNIRGIDALTTEVLNCWASLWTARAMAYRAREGIQPGDVRLTVVVQEMVAADAAGVMFTANPATGRRDQIVIGAGGSASPWSAGQFQRTISSSTRPPARWFPGGPPTSRS
jgi:pyruvate,water dikinase